MSYRIANKEFSFCLEGCGATLRPVPHLGRRTTMCPKCKSRAEAENGGLRWDRSSKASKAHVAVLQKFAPPSADRPWDVRWSEVEQA